VCAEKDSPKLLSAEINSPTVITCKVRATPPPLGQISWKLLALTFKHWPVRVGSHGCLLKSYQKASNLCLSPLKLSYAYEQTVQFSIGSQGSLPMIFFRRLSYIQYIIIMFTVQDIFYRNL